jgi:hypothetical protein
MKVKKTYIATIITALIISVVFLGSSLPKHLGSENILMIIGLSEFTGTLSQPTPTSLLPTQSIPTIEAHNIPEEYQGKLHLFILAGQSNMSGRGGIPQPVSAPNPRIYVFGNDYQWRLAAEPIDDPTNQVDKVSEDENAGFSPALPFAATIVEHRPEMLIGLIPCAMDDTTIQDWGRNLSDETLYGSCLKRARTASTMGSVSGILFFQGESDALDPKKNSELNLSPNQWADKFTVFINDWRSDLGLTDMPVVFAQIGTNTRPNRYPNWEVVQEQQSSVRLPFCKMITTNDLTLKDTVHFTTESYQIIGRRFAEAYLEILQGQ